MYNVHVCHKRRDPMGKTPGRPSVQIPYYRGGKSLHYTLYGIPTTDE